MTINELIKLGHNEIADRAKEYQKIDYQKWGLVLKEIEFDSNLAGEFPFSETKEGVKYWDSINKGNFELAKKLIK